MYNSGRGDRDLPGPGPSDISSILHPGSLRSFSVETDRNKGNTPSADTPANIARQEASRPQESEWLKGEKACLQEWADAQRADLEAWKAKMEQEYPSVFSERVADQKTSVGGEGKEPQPGPDTELHTQLTEDLARLDEQLEKARRELGLPAQKSEGSGEAPATSAEADPEASTTSSEATSRLTRWKDGFHSLVGKIMHRSDSEATEVPATKEPESSGTEAASDSSPGMGKKIALIAAALTAEWMILGNGQNALYQEVIAPHIFHRSSETAVTRSGAMDLERAGRQRIISEKDVPIWEASSQGARFDGAVHVTVGRQEDGTRTVEITSPFPLSLSGQPANMVETIRNGRFDAKFPVSNGQGDFKIYAAVDHKPDLALGGQPADQNQGPAVIFDSSELEPE
ncbi:MAG: hypothetical protein J2P37_14940 [Ktedonobacteraceae bacterium]|nr:hypothetical protein [Ktedonobacteraceae bacterium]